MKTSFDDAPHCEMCARVDKNYQSRYYLIMEWSFTADEKRLLRDLTEGMDDD